eukprot:9029-Heterococcus_DN1.PRE.2
MTRCDEHCSCATAAAELHDDATAAAAHRCRNGNALVSSTARCHQRGFNGQQQRDKMQIHQQRVAVNNAIIKPSMPKILLHYYPLLREPHAVNTTHLE